MQKAADLMTKCEHGCDGSGWILKVSTNTAAPCKCQSIERSQRMLDKCGISEAFRKMTFNNYKPKNDIQKNALRRAGDYADKFDTYRKDRNNSIAFLEQVGAGKTHLGIAIANELMAKGINIVYMPFKEATTYLKQVKTDEFKYQIEIHKYKDAEVLILDDLFKLSERNDKTSEADIDLMYEIINYRYMNAKPMIVSSEKSVDELVEIDQATGSRIVEMCRGRIIIFKGIELNDRLI